MSDPPSPGMGVWRRFPLTGAAIALAVLVTAAAATMDINVVDLNLSLLERVERSELDEVMTAWGIVVVAFVVDQVIASRGRRQESALDAERLRVVQVTMRSVQDIVGNCLTELQLLRLEAEGAVPAETLALFDESIRVASARLKTIEELRVFAERQMAVGFGLNVDPAAPR